MVALRSRWLWRSDHRDRANKLNLYVDVLYQEPPTPFFSRWSDDRYREIRKVDVPSGLGMTDDAQGEFECLVFGGKCVWLKVQPRTIWKPVKLNMVHSINPACFVLSGYEDGASSGQRVR